MIAARQKKTDFRAPLGKTGFYILVCALGFIFVLPFLWALLTTFKTSDQLYKVPPNLFPNPVSVEAWRDVWDKAPILRSFGNSVFVTVLSLFGQLLSCSLAAYSFARLRFRGRNVLFLLVLSALMLPSIITLIPTYVLFKNLGWTNSFIPLILPNWVAAGGGSAVTIFLLRQFFMAIPYSLDEAAKLDGANYFTIYLRIIMPLSKPILAALFALNFVQHWNRFIEPLIYLQSPDKLTLPIALRVLAEATAGSAQQRFPTDHLLMAGSLISLLPALLLYIAAQRYLVSITISGSKG
jgi:multiple sugar transport system permease protein